MVHQIDFQWANREIINGRGNYGPSTDLAVGRGMTALELANFLHVHIGTVLKLVKRGETFGFKVGDQWRFELETVDRWMKRADPE